jgi:hypothetical protein
MAEEQSLDGGEQVKSCPSCGGTWPANRPICPACGTGLAGVTARPEAELAGEGEFDWRWLDALAPEEEGPEEEEEEEQQQQQRGRQGKQQSKRPWWQFWR